MPHLAPLSWALAPFIFWFLLILFVSLLWWEKQPVFPSSDSSSSYSFSSWNWS